MPEFLNPNVWFEDRIFSISKSIILFPKIAASHLIGLVNLIE